VSTVGLTIDLPEELMIAASCCVGSSFTSSIPIFNGNSSNIDIRLSVGPVAINGRVVDHSGYSPFNIQCVNVQLASGKQQDVQVC